MKRIRFGSHEFDPATGELFRDGQIVKLQPQPSRVLSLLLSQPGEVVSREQLREALWPDGTTVEFDQGLNFCVRQIRSALGESASDPEFVETLPKKGYRFIAAIERPAEMAPLPLSQPPSSQPPSSPPQPTPSRLRWPLLAGALFLLSLLVGWVWYGNRTGTPPKSILVQAFVPMGMTEEDAWYGDAIAQQLISHLSKTQAIRVLPWSNSSAVRDRKLTALEAARDQGVEAVLEGSVRKEQQRLVVTAQLVDAKTERVIWSYRDDRPGFDLGAVESAVTASMAKALRFRIVEGEQPLTRRRPEDPETYNLYLKALALNDRMTPTATATAVEAFEEVLRRAPSFAPAHVGLANVLVLETFTRGQSREANLARALALANRALELDPESADAHGAKAHVMFQSWNWAEADREFQTALRLNPNSPAILHLYAVFLGTQRRFEEAAEALRQAENLDPTSSLISATQCRIAFYAKRYDEAIAACKKALVIDPARQGSKNFLGRIYVQKGMKKEALQHFEESRKTNSFLSERLWIAYCAAVFGDAITARAELSAWEKKSRKSKILPLPYAITKLELGDKGAGLEALGQLVQDRWVNSVWLKSAPELDKYRDHPRVQEILAQLGSD